MIFDGQFQSHFGQVKKISEFHWSYSDFLPLGKFGRISGESLPVVLYDGDFHNEWLIVKNGRKLGIELDLSSERLEEYLVSVRFVYDWSLGYFMELRNNGSIFLQLGTSVNKKLDLRFVFGSEIQVKTTKMSFGEGKLIDFDLSVVSYDFSSKTLVTLYRDKTLLEIFTFDGHISLESLKIVFFSENLLGSA